MSIWVIFVIAISLSMDAFSLSLAYGTLDIAEKDMSLLSVTVGIYHFVMPLLGIFLGSFLIKILPINPNIIVFIVLSFIGLQMIIESFKTQEQVKKMTKIEMLVFGLAVSIDSFSVGIGLKMLNASYLLCACAFAFSSLAFTFLGLHLGKKIHQRIGRISTKLGGITLITLGILYLL